MTTTSNKSRKAPKLEGSADLGAFALTLSEQNLILRGMVAEQKKHLYTTSQFYNAQHAPRPEFSDGDFTALQLVDGKGGTCLLQVVCTFEKPDLILVVCGAATTHPECTTANDAKLVLRSLGACLDIYRRSGKKVGCVIVDLASACDTDCYVPDGSKMRLNKTAPEAAIFFQNVTAQNQATVLLSKFPNTNFLLAASAAWVHDATQHKLAGALRPGFEQLGKFLRDGGAPVETLPNNIDYPSRFDLGKSFGDELKRLLAQTLALSGPEMAALELPTTAEKLVLSALLLRVQSAGGTAAMAGPHAGRIHSAGGTATMTGPHAHRLQLAGSANSPHTGRPPSDGQTPAMAARAAYVKERYHAKKAKEAAEAKKEKRTMASFFSK